MELARSCCWPKQRPSIHLIFLSFIGLWVKISGLNRELLDEHWAKIVRSEDISTPIYVECDKMYRSKVQGFWYYVSGLDIQLEKSEYDSPLRKKIGCRWQNTTSHVLFFFEQSIRTNGLAVMACRREKGDMGSIPDLCGNDCSALAILRGTEPVSALTLALFILLLSL